MYVVVEWGLEAGSVSAVGSRCLKGLRLVDLGW